MKNTLFASISALCLSVSPLALTGAAAADLSEADVKKLALEAILENPEIIMQAVEILQAREAAEQAAQTELTLSAQRNLLENDPNAFVLGNPDGDVTVVEFFDYNCGYCKRAMPEVKALLASDPNVRLVMREWPILSEGSMFASRAALASREQGRYEDFHWALMEQRGRIEEAVVMRIAQDLGLDIQKLVVDMESEAVQDHLQTSTALTQSLGFGGTPSFVIGNELVPGMVDADEMKRLVALSRDG